MEIHHITYGDNSIRNINGEKNAKAASEKKTVPGDSVTINGNDGAAAHVSSVDAEFSPRIDVVRSVSERAARGEYDSKLLRAVAGKVVDSPAVKDIITEVAMNSTDNADERAEMVEQAQLHVAQGYYDDPEVKRTIADRLLNVLGLSQSVDRLL